MQCTLLGLLTFYFTICSKCHGSSCGKHSLLLQNHRLYADKPPLASNLWPQWFQTNNSWELLQHLKVRHLISLNFYMPFLTTHHLLYSNICTLTQHLEFSEPEPFFTPHLLLILKLTTNIKVIFLSNNSKSYDTWIKKIMSYKSDNR